MIIFLTLRKLILIKINSIIYLIFNSSIENSDLFIDIIKNIFNIEYEEEKKKKFIDFLDLKNLKIELDSLYKQTLIGMLVSSYYCTILGLYVGNSKEFNLDFMAFAKDNFYNYKKFKALIDIEL